MNQGNFPRSWINYHHNSLTVDYLLLSPDETVFPKWKKKIEKEVSTFWRNAIKKTDKRSKHNREK